jgi:TolB-like protein/tRNA A-37 threonylcarbamoyl transferase component Bud32
VASDLLELLREALSEHYAVESEVGRGGMATVFLAEDLKHGRRVAIKVLTPELSTSIDSDRFKREIQIAARLSHPHILPVFDSGDANGLLYYVMPFVEGESLRGKLQRETQLSIDEAVTIACEVADALSYAHAFGVVHRDIKPENILLHGGHAVVADFGIAQVIQDAGGERLTQTGKSIGTALYMSPEQFSGAQVDGRSDMYSLACVLYEMLVGEVPFTGPNVVAIMARHTMELPPSIQIVRGTVPNELEGAILQALEKVPADRFATVAQFKEALLGQGATSTYVRHTRAYTKQHAAIPARVVRRRRRRTLAAGAVGIILLAVGSLAGRYYWVKSHGPLVTQAGEVAGLSARRIAVLYFEDRSRDHQLGPLASGLTESLIERLNEVRTLDVISKNGVRPFENPLIESDSVASVLKAGTIVRGSVEDAGPRVHIEVRLIDGASGTEVNRASFNHPRGDLIALQDSLAGDVAAWLRTRVGDEVRLRERRASTSSTNAWLLFQRSEKLRHDADDLARKGNSKAAAGDYAQADSILAATEVADGAWLEPVVARGWVALSRSQLERGANAFPWISIGLAHAERALQRAPNSPEALALRGELRYQNWALRVSADPAVLDTLLKNARRDLESAVAADPTLARANITLSHLYYQTEDVPGALLAARHAYEEDAYLEDSDETLFRLFWGSLDLEQFIEARRWCGEGARRFPRDIRFAQCRLWLMATPAVAAEPAQARQLLSMLDSLTPPQRRPFIVAQGRLLVSGALARAGLVDSARTVLRTARASVTHDVDPNQDLLSQEAYIRTLTGEPDVAINLLKQYVAANPGHEFLQQAGTVWWWRELRTHPRWREIGHAGR